MAGKAHVVIFVEGDTDKLLFDALVRYYRQLVVVTIQTCLSMLNDLWWTGIVWRLR